MSGIRVVCAIALAASLILSGGACTKKKRDAGGKESVDALPENASDRASRLQATVQDLSGTLAQLPSGDDAKDQRNIGVGLNQLSTALRLIADDETSGAFMQQIATIDRTASMLSQGASDRDPEPVINSGFWATLNALQYLSRTFDDSQTIELVAQLDAQVRELDTVRGPLHRLVASDTLRSSSQVVMRMADLYQQAAQRRESTPEPATAPAE